MLFCIAQASVEEIDTLNILQATMLAMRRAVEGLRLRPHKVLVDGNRIPTLKIAAEAIVEGDAKVKAISAASILAKVHRDRLCLDCCTRSTRSTASTATRATRRRMHLAALRRTAPAPAPPSASRRCARRAAASLFGIVPVRMMAARQRRSPSRDNPLLVRLRKLAADPAAYRKLGEVWIEGEHLCSAFVQRGGAVRRR